ncbi:MAG: tryptophan-rich sensory protein [Rhodobacteraceae bacterium]|nr:tryptophan-rich sensory protein [Paracoccaceae bacterium]MCB2138940.1 tryptophan-rich sensory protein [Paracoccaceae bacterium]MCO5127089.1 tryptophan-rich sensory protein [Paracoccaceae bacterium]
MDWATLLVFLAATAVAAATGALFSPGEWYAGLDKAPWTPPSWAFGVVWTALYVAMAYAAARIAGLPGAGLALALFALQIALNTIWTPVFFGVHRTGLAMVIIVCLWLVVAAMLVAFWRLDRFAGVLLMPYVAWLTLAASLNFWIWRFNPTI